MADYELLDQNGRPRYINKRVRYYDNQVLIDQDFIDDQKFHLDGRRRHERLLHVSGVCEGLTVAASGGLKVTIAAGTALDPLGRQILLDTATEFTVTRVGTQRLYVRYREEETDEAARGKGAAGKTRFWQRPEIGAVDPSALPLYAIVLATLDATASMVTVKTEGREYSGIRLPGPVAASAPTLRSGGDSAYTTAVLTGALSLSGNLTTAAVKVLGSSGATVFEVKTDGGVSSGVGSTPPFQVSTAGAIATATGITSSGTVKLTSLPGTGATTSKFVKVGTDGVLASSTTVDLSSAEVSATLPFTRGGTGQTAWTQNALVYVNSASTLGSVTPETNSVLVTGSSPVPTLAQTLPDTVQGNITKTGTLVSLAVGTAYNKFVVSESGAITGTSALSVGTGTTRFTVDTAGAITDASGIVSKGAVRFSSLPGSDATTTKFVKVGTDGTLASVNTVDLSSAEVTATLPTTRGGTGQTAWTQNALVFSSSTSQLSSLTPAASSVLVTSSSSAPSLSTTLPSTVQDNIIRLGAVTSGSIGSGFGSIVTTTLNASTAVQTGGTTRIDASGNLSAIGTITSTGIISTKNSTAGSDQGGVTIDRSDLYKEANLRFASNGSTRWNLRLEDDNSEHLRLVSAGGPGFVQSWDYGHGHTTIRGDIILNNVFVGPGTLTLKNNTTDTLQGDGTNFQVMSAGDEIRVNSTTYTIASISSSTELKVSSTVSGLVTGTYYAYTWRSANNYVSCDGKVSLRSGTTDTLLGSGTTFKSIFQPGDEIKITVSSTSTVVATIESVVSDSQLTVTTSLALSEGNQYTFSARKQTKRISFGAAKQSLIEFNSSSDEHSDKGFILFKEQSSEFGSSSGTENGRLAIGIFGDVGSSSKNDTVDIQGAHQLTLNVGAWDDELDIAIGEIASTVTPSGISFRVNNSEKVGIDSTGKLSVGAGYSGSSAATLFSVGSSTTPFKVDSSGAITSAASASIGTGTNKFSVDSSGAVTAATSASIGTGTNKFSVDSSGAISAATSASIGTGTSKFTIDSAGAVTAPTSLSVGGSTFTVSSAGKLTAATGLTSSGTITLSGLSTGSTGTKFVRQGSDNTLAVTSNVDLSSSDVTSTLPVSHGGTGVTSITANGIVYASSTSALATTAAAASSILVTSSSSVPSLTTTLPSAVQLNITSLGTVTAGTIASGFGSITTTTLNATSSVQTNGTVRIDSSGNLSSIGSVSLTGDITFGAATSRKILFNSSTDYGSDKGFILWKEDSDIFSTGSSQNARLSIGAYSDTSSTYGDTLDLQGSYKLILNVGEWDSELDSAIGTNSNATTGGISFRINNTEKFSITTDGYLRGSGSSKMFEYKSFTNTSGGSTSTGYSTTSWYACVVGFDAGSGDLYENKSGDNLLKCYCYEYNSTWYVKSDMRTHDSTTWTIYVLFINKQLF